MSSSPTALLLGHPVAHSRSPALMAALSEASGAPLDYGLLDVVPADLESCLETLRTQAGLVGANVTVPHKLRALELADERDAVAERVGAANVLSRTPEGRLRAYNTDVGGFTDALKAWDAAVDGATVWLIGAGGAARAVVESLAAAGAQSIKVHNRSPDKIEELRALHSGVSPLSLQGDGAQPALVVQATSLGIHPGDAARIAAWMGPIFDRLEDGGGEALLCDLVYHPSGRTPFLDLAEARGLRTLGDGGWMLAGQAARAFQLWTGAPSSALPPLVRLVEAVREG